LGKNKNKHVADPEPDESEVEEEPTDAEEWEERSLARRLSELAEDLTGELSYRLRRFAIDAGSASLSMSRALFVPPDNQRLAEEAGHYLRELRELAGLTIDELASAIKLEDRTLLQAVEDGSATLSFDLVLRLTAILARHDPIPFLIRFTRTYNPDVWSVLEGSVGKLPLHFEREREFVNIYRGDDRARELSDEGFARVLELTRSAFALGVHYATEREADDSE
jgi:transcriptional regulator with XRE-family HTH domain